MNHPIIDQNRFKIAKLCENHKVKSLFVFGSLANGGFKNDSSDIDLMVDIDENDPVLRGEHLMTLWLQLELLFGRNVDLITFHSIKNPVFKKSVEQTKKILYERPD